MIALEREWFGSRGAETPAPCPRGQSRQIECTFLPVDKQRTSSTIIGWSHSDAEGSGIWNERGQGGSPHTARLRTDQEDEANV